MIDTCQLKQQSNCSCSRCNLTQATLSVAAWRMSDFASLVRGKMMQDKVHYETTCTLSRHMRQTCSQPLQVRSSSRVYIVTCLSCLQRGGNVKIPPGLSRSPALHCTLGRFRTDGGYYGLPHESDTGQKPRDLALWLRVLPSLASIHVTITRRAIGLPRHATTVRYGFPKMRRRGDNANRDQDRTREAAI
jgi:hypothetical protein